jgi:hypothetical protein
VSLSHNGSRLVVTAPAGANAGGSTFQVVFIYAHTGGQWELEQAVYPT